ncbi:MAG: hypothetical protein AB9903_23480 [Vulcanimicrobiota bacterium]
MAKSDQNTNKQSDKNPLHHHLAFFAVATLILFVIVTLPFTLTSAFKDVLDSPESEIYPIPGGPRPEEYMRHSHVGIVIASLDELQQLLNLRVYIRRDFRWTANYKERIILFSVPSDDIKGELPPSVTIDYPVDEFCSTQTVQLPVRGQPLRYPFDVYDMKMGVLMQRVYSDKRTENLTAEEAKGYLFMTLSEHLPRQKICRPVDLDPLGIEGPISNCRYMYVENIVLKRPLYLKVLAVLLVLLVAAAASFAVFLRPLKELIVNSGALVLGVWGIRSILVSGSSSFVNAVDLALSTVILFLLLAISIRTFIFFKDKIRVDLPGWKCKPVDTCEEEDADSEKNCQ